MDIFIWIVAALAVALAYVCGKADGACLACKCSKNKFKKG